MKMHETTKNDKQKKARLRYAVLVVLTLAILLALFVDARDSLNRLTRPQFVPFLCGVLLTALFPVLMAIRWASTLWAGGYHVTFKTAFRATMAAWPLGTLTPSKTGDLAKAFAVRDSVPLPTGLGSVVAERAIDVTVLLVLSLIGSILLSERWIALFAISGIVAAIIGWTAIAREWNLPMGAKWSERLAQFRVVWQALASRPRYLMLSGGASAFNWFLSIWQVQFFFSAYGIDVPLAHVCAALPVAIFVGLLPITVAGMGTRDKAIMVLFAPFAPESICLSVGILYSICGYILPSLAGLPFLKSLYGDVRP